MNFDWTFHTDRLDEYQRRLVEDLAVDRRLRLRMATITPDVEYLGMSDFLLQHGTWYSPVDLPLPFSYLTPGLCFGNATAMAELHAVKYIEGAALYSPSLPYAHHAWNYPGRQAGHDLALDVTWDKGGFAYLGVEFPWRYNLRLLKHGSTVLQNHYEGYPIFRSRYDPEVGPATNKFSTSQAQKRSK